MRICTCHLRVDAEVTAEARGDEVGHVNPSLQQGERGGVNVTFALLQGVSMTASGCARSCTNTSGGQPIPQRVHTSRVGADKQLPAPFER